MNNPYFETTFRSISMLDAGSLKKLLAEKGNN